MKHINLEQFAGGELTAQVNRELETVTRNIQDPNTEAKKARKITVSITIKPNESRDVSIVSVEAKSTLVPALGAVTMLRMGKDLRTGEVEAVEAVTGQIPGQMSVADMPGVMPEDKKPDPETGEMKERALAVEGVAGSTVVDMRRKA